jgi:hypothetical protein
MDISLYFMHMATPALPLNPQIEWNGAQFTLFLSLQLLTMSLPMIYHSYDSHKPDYSDFATLHVPGQVPEL